MKKALFLLLCLSQMSFLSAKEGFQPKGPSPRGEGQSSVPQPDSSGKRRAVGLIFLLKKVVIK